MPTEAHRARNRRYREKQDQIVLIIPKGSKEAIKQQAALKGYSMNAYIVELLQQDLGCSLRDFSEKDDTPPE